MKLYEFGPTRAIRARWTLQELGIGFESVSVDLMAGEHRRPEFRKLNPCAKLPVLVDGDFVLTESVAIVLYLAEKYPQQRLLPADLRDRTHEGEHPALQRRLHSRLESRRQDGVHDAHAGAGSEEEGGGPRGDGDEADRRDRQAGEQHTGEADHPHAGEPRSEDQPDKSVPMPCMKL